MSRSLAVKLLTEQEINDRKLAIHQREFNENVARDVFIESLPYSRDFPRFISNKVTSRLQQIVYLLLFLRCTFNGNSSRHQRLLLRTL